MVKITIELLPPLTRLPKIIGRAEIINEGTGSPERGDYKYALWGKRGAVWKTGQIICFPRKSYNVWRLLYYILKQVFE